MICFFFALSTTSSKTEKKEERTLEEQFTVGDVLDFFQEAMGKEFIVGQCSTDKDRPWEKQVHQKVGWIFAFQAGAGRQKSDQPIIPVSQLIGNTEEELSFISRLAFRDLCEWASDHCKIRWPVAA